MLPVPCYLFHFRFSATSPTRQRATVEYLIYCTHRHKTPNRDELMSVCGIRQRQTAILLVSMLIDAQVIQTADGAFSGLYVTSKGRVARFPVPMGNTPDDNCKTVLRLDPAPETNTSLDLHINERPHIHWTPPTIHRAIVAARVQS